MRCKDAPDNLSGGQCSGCLNRHPASGIRHPFLIGIRHLASGIRYWANLLKKLSLFQRGRSGALATRSSKLRMIRSN
jgi:hypothetical protein